MTSPRLFVVVLCLVAMVGAPAVCRAVPGVKLRPGDTCIVTTDGAPAKKAGRVVATLTKGGAVGLVKATPDGHDVVSSFRVPGARSHVWAHLAICEGRLYVRYQGTLFAYDIKK